MRGNFIITGTCEHWQLGMINILNRLYSVIFGDGYVYLASCVESAFVYNSENGFSAAVITSNNSIILARNCVSSNEFGLQVA